MSGAPWSIVFFGTAEVSRIVLEALLRGPDQVRAAVSQPDRPTGRGRKLELTEVRLVAEAAGLPLRQPERMRDPELRQWLAGFEADLFCVAAFGRILPPEMLAIPRRGCLNVHTSLLPKLRGAAPIQWAVANGERVTGVTIMQMDQGMDTGPILLQRELEIGPRQSAAELTPLLAALGGGLLLEAVAGLKAGALEPRPQDHAAATLAPPLTKKHGLIDWSMPAQRIADRVRGFTPWPGCHTFLEGELLKLLAVAVLEAQPGAAAAGEVLAGPKGELRVACGSGALSVLKLQIAGKKPLDSRAFLAGRPIAPGVRLG